MVDVPIASPACKGRVGAHSDELTYGCAAGLELVAKAKTVDACQGDSGGPSTSRALAATGSSPARRRAARATGRSAVMAASTRGSIATSRGWKRRRAFDSDDWTPWPERLRSDPGPQRDAPGLLRWKWSGAA